MWVRFAHGIYEKQSLVDGVFIRRKRKVQGDSFFSSLFSNKLKFPCEYNNNSNKNRNNNNKGKKCAVVFWQELYYVQQFMNAHLTCVIIKERSDSFLLGLFLHHEDGSSRFDIKFVNYYHTTRHYIPKDSTLDSPRV
jgi:hypothetical protein